MPVEAELKAIVRDVQAVSAALERRAPGRPSAYADRYFDFPDRRLTWEGRELRVRVITDHDGRRVVLTYKEPAAHASGSKPEHETIAADAQVLAVVLEALGLRELIAFEKHCVNHRFTAHGRDMLATLVTVPELDGQTFIELETLTAPDDLDCAVADVRAVLGELGVMGADVTDEAYTDAVARRRADSA